MVFVPASCTDQLQPLDAIPNKLFKEELKSCFHAYYTESVVNKLKNKQAVSEIDLRTSAIKPIHARWLMKAVDKLSKSDEMIRQSFEKCGI